MNLIKRMKQFIDIKIKKIYFIKKTPFFCYYKLKDIKNNYYFCERCPYCKGYTTKNDYIQPIKGMKGYSRKWKGKFYKREIWRLYSVKCEYNINRKIYC